MTDSKSKHRFEKLSSGLQVVESILPRKLIENLNIEISQKVITNLKQAIDWIKGTFFFRRVAKNPSVYGVRDKSKEDIESHLVKQCTISLESLHDLGLISLQTKDMQISPLPGSHSMSQFLVPYKAMQKIVRLSHDSGQLQILVVLSQIEELQFPLRRNEKKHLNDVHKMIKYKLEGQPSKVRVQTQEQKAFVLLQSAIGQHYIEDFTLRNEMSMMVDTARRMLSAAEDYSIEGSMHGKVALESLLLRRSISTSLWGPGDGVLNQLPGVGHKTASKMAMNKIRSFGDVLSKTSDDIEQACGRQSPFGQQLRAAVKKIFYNSLSLTIQVKDIDDEKKSTMLICYLNYREDDDVDQNKRHREHGVVSYVLCVFTDRPGGSLMFRKNISTEGEHKITCPPKFGRLYIHLISNFVGLDEVITFDGNDKIDRGQFKLSPEMRRTRNKNLTKTPSKSLKKKEVNSELKKVVENVQDARISGKTSKQNMNSISKEYIASPDPNFQKQPDLNKNITKSEKKSLTKAFVTPSPTLHIRKNTQYKDSIESKKSDWHSTIDSYQSPERQVSRNRNIPKYNKNYVNDVNSKTTEQNRNKIYNNYSNNDMRRNSDNGNKIIWKKQKRQQTSLQERAFGRAKENPFETFKFDPNNIENQLDSAVNKSILPPSVMNKSQNLNKIHAQRRSRFISGNPSKSNLLFSAGSGRRKRAGITSSRLSNHEILRMKAEEQQAYAFASTNRVNGPWSPVAASNPYSVGTTFNNSHDSVSNQPIVLSQSMMTDCPGQMNSIPCYNGHSYVQEQPIHYSQSMIPMHQYNNNEPIYGMSNTFYPHHHQQNMMSQGSPYFPQQSELAQGGITRFKSQKPVSPPPFSSQQRPPLSSYMGDQNPIYNYNDNISYSDPLIVNNQQEEGLSNRNQFDDSISSNIPFLSQQQKQEHDPRLFFTCNVPPPVDHITVPVPAENYADKNVNASSIFNSAENNISEQSIEPNRLEIAASFDDAFFN